MSEKVNAFTSVHNPLSTDGRCHFKDPTTSPLSTLTITNTVSQNSIEVITHPCVESTSDLSTDTSNQPNENLNSISDTRKDDSKVEKSSPNHTSELTTSTLSLSEIPTQSSSVGSSHTDSLVISPVTEKSMDHPLDLPSSSTNSLVKTSVNFPNSPSACRWNISPVTSTVSTVSENATREQMSIPCNSLTPLVNCALSCGNSSNLPGMQPLCTMTSSIAPLDVVASQSVSLLPSLCSTSSMDSFYQDCVAVTNGTKLFQLSTSSVSSPNVSLPNSPQTDLVIPPTPSIIPTVTSVGCPISNFNAACNRNMPSLSLAQPTNMFPMISSSNVPLITNPQQTLPLSSSGSLALENNPLGYDPDRTGFTPSTPLPPFFTLNLMPLNTNGDFPPVQINHPGLPVVRVQVLPLPGAKMGEQYTINVPSQLIRNGIASALANGSSLNGGPIMLSIASSSTSAPSSNIFPMPGTPLTPAQATNSNLPTEQLLGANLPSLGQCSSGPIDTIISSSAMQSIYTSCPVATMASCVSTSSGIGGALSAVLINSLTAQPITITSAPKRMRAIAPKPSGSTASTVSKSTMSSGTSKTKRQSIVNLVPNTNVFVSNTMSIPSSSVVNVTGSGLQIPSSKSLQPHCQKLSLTSPPNISSPTVRSGRGRRKGPHSLTQPTSYPPAPAFAPGIVANTGTPCVGITSENNSISSFQSSAAIPQSNLTLPPFFTTQSLLVSSAANAPIPGSVMQSGSVPPAFLFGSSLPNLPSGPMNGSVTPFLFQQALPLSNGCPQFPPSIYNSVTCTTSMSSTSCPLTVVRSMPPVSSGTLFATGNPTAMASLDPTTGLVTYFQSPCIPMNNPYAPVSSTPNDPSSLSLSAIYSQSSHQNALNIVPTHNTQPGSIMYPIPGQPLVPQVMSTLFPSLPSIPSSVGSTNFPDQHAFVQPFTTNLIDASCIPTNELLTTDCSIPTSASSQNVFYSSSSEFESGPIPVFPSLQFSPNNAHTLQDYTDQSNASDVTEVVEGEGCLAKDDLISLAWRLTQMEDEYEAIDKNNLDSLSAPVLDDGNGMFDEFLQSYAQNTNQGFSFTNELNSGSHSVETLGTETQPVGTEVVILGEAGPNIPVSTFSAPSTTSNSSQLIGPAEESTGNADIDALLAAAAMVGAASGVGDAQSSVTVPVPSSSAFCAVGGSTNDESPDMVVEVEKSVATTSVQLAYSSSSNSCGNDDTIFTKAQSNNCSFSPLMIPSSGCNTEGQEQSLSKEHGLLPSDLFSDFDAEENGIQFANEPSESIQEFDDNYEPTSLVAVLGCNAEEAADLASVFGPDASDATAVSNSFLQSLVGPSPTDEDLVRENDAHIFDDNFPNVCDDNDSNSPVMPGDLNPDGHVTSESDEQSVTNESVPSSRQVRSLLRDTPTTTVADTFEIHDQSSKVSKSLNPFFEATSRRHSNRFRRYSSDIDDDFIGVDLSDAANEYTTAEEFNEALLLLGPQPSPPIQLEEAQKDDQVAPISSDGQINDECSSEPSKIGFENSEHVILNNLGVVDDPDSDSIDHENIVLKGSIDAAEVTLSHDDPVTVQSVEETNAVITPKDVSLVDAVDENVSNANTSAEQPLEAVTIDDAKITTQLDDLYQLAESKPSEPSNFDEQKPMVSIETENYLSTNLADETEINTEGSLFDGNLTKFALNSKNSSIVCKMASQTSTSTEPAASQAYGRNAHSAPCSPQPIVGSLNIKWHSVNSLDYKSVFFRQCSTPFVLEALEVNASNHASDAKPSSADSFHSIESSVAEPVFSKPSSSSLPDEPIDVNLESVLPEYNILGVLASSSALVEAAVDLGDDSDISPLKSSIEGLASLDRILKSCQRQSQQTFDSAHSTSTSLTNSAENAVSSSSCGSGLSLLPPAQNKETVSVSAVSTSASEHLSTEAPIEVQISSNFQESPNHNSSSLSEKQSVQLDPIVLQSSESEKKPAVRGRPGRKRRKLSNAPKPSKNQPSRSKSLPNSTQASSCDLSISGSGADGKLTETSDCSQIESSLLLTTERPHSFGLPANGTPYLTSAPKAPVEPAFERHLPRLSLSIEGPLFPHSLSDDEQDQELIKLDTSLQTADDYLKPVHSSATEENVIEDPNSKMVSSPLSRFAARKRKRQRHRHRNVSEGRQSSKTRNKLRSATPKYDRSPSPVSHALTPFATSVNDGKNSNLIETTNIIGNEAPFARFLHFTDLPSFETLKPDPTKECSSTQKNKSIPPWVAESGNKVLFGMQSNSIVSDEKVPDTTDLRNDSSNSPEPTSNSMMSTTEEPTSQTSALLKPTESTERKVPKIILSTKPQFSPLIKFSDSHSSLSIPTFACQSPLTFPSQSFGSLHANPTINPLSVSLPSVTASSTPSSLGDNNSSTVYSPDKLFPPAISPLPTNRVVGMTFGSFAGAAAFRCTSFSALAARVGKKSIGTPGNVSPLSILNNPMSFADLAKSATTVSFDKTEVQIEGTATPWFVNKNLRIDASALKPKPLFQSTVERDDPPQTKPPQSLEESSEALFVQKQTVDDVIQTSCSDPPSLTVDTPFTVTNFTPSPKSEIVTPIEANSHPTSLHSSVSSRKSTRGRRSSLVRRSKRAHRKTKSSVGGSHDLDNASNCDSTVPQTTEDVNLDSTSSQFVEATSPRPDSRTSPLTMDNITPDTYKDNTDSLPEYQSVVSPFIISGQSGDSELIPKDNNDPETLPISSPHSSFVEDIDPDNIQSSPKSKTSPVLTTTTTTNATTTTTTNTLVTVDGPPSSPNEVLLSNQKFHVETLNSSSDSHPNSPLIVDKLEPQPNHILDEESKVDINSQENPQISISTSNNETISSNPELVITESVTEIVPTTVQPPIRLKLNLKLGLTGRSLTSKKKRRKRKLTRISTALYEETSDTNAVTSLSIRLTKKPKISDDGITSGNDTPDCWTKVDENLQTSNKMVQRSRTKVESIIKNRINTAKSNASVIPNHVSEVTGEPAKRSSLTIALNRLTPNQYSTRITSAFTRKIFSTARQDRRSSCAQLNRPWRPNLSTSPRKRGSGLHRGNQSRRSLSNNSSAVLPNTSNNARSSEAYVGSSKLVTGQRGRSNRLSGRGRGSSKNVPSAPNTTTTAVDTHASIPDAGKLSTDSEGNNNGSIRLIIRLPKAITSSGEDEKVVRSICSPLSVRVPSEQSPCSHAAQSSTESMIDKNTDQTSFVDTASDGLSKSECANVDNDMCEFCIATEAETYMDPNQVQIHRLLNKALPIGTGLLGLYLPSPSDNEDGEGGLSMGTQNLDSGHQLLLSNQTLRLTSRDRPTDYSAIMAPQVGCTADLSASRQTNSPKLVTEDTKRNRKHLKRGRPRANKSNEIRTSSPTQKLDYLASDIRKMDCTNPHFDLRHTSNPTYSFPEHRLPGLEFPTSGDNTMVTSSVFELGSFHSLDSYNLYKTGHKSKDSIAANCASPLSTHNHSANPNVSPSCHSPVTAEDFRNMKSSNSDSSKEPNATFSKSAGTAPITTVGSGQEYPVSDSDPCDSMHFTLQHSNPKNSNVQLNHFEISDNSLGSLSQTSIDHSRVSDNMGASMMNVSYVGSGGRSNSTSSVISVPAPSTGSPAPLSLGPAPGSQPEYSGLCPSSFNESGGGGSGSLTPLHSNRDSNCSPRSVHYGSSEKSLACLRGSRTHCTSHPCSPKQKRSRSDAQDLVTNPLVLPPTSDSLNYPNIPKDCLSIPDAYSTARHNITNSDRFTASSQVDESCDNSSLTQQRALAAATAYAAAYACLDPTLTSRQQVKAYYDHWTTSLFGRLGVNNLDNAVSLSPYGWTGTNSTEIKSPNSFSIPSQYPSTDFDDRMAYRSIDLDRFRVNMDSQSTDNNYDGGGGGKPVCNGWPWSNCNKPSNSSEPNPNTCSSDPSSLDRMTSAMKLQFNQTQNPLISHLDNNHPSSSLFPDVLLRNVSNTEFDSQDFHPIKSGSSNHHIPSSYTQGQLSSDYNCFGSISVNEPRIYGWS